MNIQLFEYSIESFLDLIEIMTDCISELSKLPILPEVKRGMFLKLQIRYCLLTKKLEPFLEEDAALTDKEWEVIFYEIDSHTEEINSVFLSIAFNLLLYGDGPPVPPHAILHPLTPSCNM